MGVEEIITLNISRETTAVSQAGFGTGMFLGAHKRFTARQLIITDASQLLTAGFASTDAEYIAAQKYFSQENKPTQLSIGRRDSDDAVTLTFEAPVAGKVYTITINDVVMTLTATTEATAADVAAAFETANAANFTTAAITFDDTAADGTAVIAPTVATTDYSIKSESGVSYAATYSETLTSAYAAIKAESDDFYFVMCYSHVKADILEMAAAVEADRKLYFTSSSESAAKDDTLSGDTTSTLKALTDGNFFRTVMLYSAVADTQYPEAAQVGEGAPSQPGSRTWSYKQLAGITQDNLNATEIANVKNKNGNVFTPILGVANVRDGKVTGGEWIDIMRGIDWLYARLTERLYSLLLNSPKIPYTDAGITLVQNLILAQRQEGIAVDFLAGSDEDTVIVPQVKDVAFNDKANRVLNGVSFSFILAGAIQFPVINGSVTL